MCQIELVTLRFTRQFTQALYVKWTTSSMQIFVVVMASVFGAMYAFVSFLVGLLLMVILSYLPVSKRLISGATLSIYAVGALIVLINSAQILIFIGYLLFSVLFFVATRYVQLRNV